MRAFLRLVADELSGCCGEPRARARGTGAVRSRGGSPCRRRRRRTRTSSPHSARRLHACSARPAKLRWSCGTKAEEHARRWCAKRRRRLASSVPRRSRRRDEGARGRGRRTRARANEIVAEARTHARPGAVRSDRAASGARAPGQRAARRAAAGSWRPTRSVERALGAGDPDDGRGAAAPADVRRCTAHHAAGDRAARTRTAPGSDPGAEAARSGTGGGRAHRRTTRPHPTQSGAAEARGRRRR